MRYAALASMVALSGCLPKPVSASALAWPRAAGILGLEAVGPTPYTPQSYQGRPVLVTFVASWCFPCLTDLAVLRRLHDDYSAKGLQLVYVGMDLEGAEALGPFAQNTDLRGPLLVASPELKRGESAFGTIRLLPARVLFGRDGVARAASAGPLDYQAADQAVREAL